MADRLVHTDEPERQALHLAIKDDLSASIVLSKLRTEYFHNPFSKAIFLAIQDVFAQNSKVNLPLVKNAIGDKIVLDHVNEIMSEAPQADIDSLCKIVVDNYWVRAVDDFCRNTRQEIDSSPIAGIDLIDKMQRKVLELTTTAKRDFVTFGESFAETLDAIKELQKEGTGIVGLPTGIPELDNKTTGFRGGQFIVVGGRPSHGKSELMINILTHMAVNEGAECALFSLEMSVEEINLRIASCLTEVPLWKLRTGNITHKDERKLEHLMEQSGKIPLHISEQPHVGPSALHAQIKKKKIECPNLACVAVDYLQLMRSDTKGENRNLELADITRGFKILASEIGIPVIVGSQMSRTVEHRQAKKPKLSDLRDSGAIEQDADVVLFVQRPDSSFEGGKSEYVIKIILEKQRNGPIGTILATNNVEIQKIFQRGDECWDEKMTPDDRGRIEPDDLPF